VALSPDIGLTARSAWRSTRRPVERKERNREHFFPGGGIGRHLCLARCARRNGAYFAIRPGDILLAEDTAGSGHRWKLIDSFALGSQDLYTTIRRNADFHCCQVEYTNPPHIIMQNDRAIAINNTTQIDLQGQAASESDGHRHISGTGGQLQFVRGAYASKGGKSFICLASTYERNGVRESRIVLDLTSGNIVITPRSDMMYVVTEFGLANLKGKSVADRAKAIIAIAHPDYREELERAARENGLIPKGYS
jgi:acyl-CoA hydrolase